MRNRYRLVTMQGDEIHTSSIVLNQEEANEMMEHEAFIHAASGWTVSVIGGSIVATKGAIERMITLRKSTPMEDAL